MAEKEVRIGLRMDLKGTGGKDAEKQLDAVGNKASAAGRSMDRMEADARDLEKALRGLAPGTVEFERTAVELGQVRAELQRTADLADSFAVKTGGAAGGLRGFGQAIGQVGFQVQDFAVQVGGGTSALTAFAQQGSQLLGSFGPGGAVAGAVLAIGAIVAKVIQLKDESADVKAFAALKDELTGIAEKSKELAAERAALGRADLSDVFDGEKDAIDRQTRAFIANIEAMRQRIQAQGSLDKILTAAALQSVDAKVGTGELSGGDAERQRAAIEAAAKQRELQRTLELSKLNEDVAKAEEAKALAQKQAAERNLALSNASAEAFAAALAEAEKRASELEAAFKAAKAFSSIFFGNDEEIFKFDPGRISQTRDRFGSMSDSDVAGFQQAFDLLAKFRQSSAAVGDTKLLQDAQGQAIQKQREAAESLAAAAKALQDASDARATAESRGSAERGAAGDQAAAEGLRDALGQTQQDFDAASQAAAEEIRRVFEDWVQSLGTNAEAQKPAELIEQVRDLLADGTNPGELESILTLAQEVARLVGNTTTRTAQGFSLIQSAVSNQSSRIEAVVRDLKRLENQVKELSKAK